MARRRDGAGRRHDFRRGRGQAGGAHKTAAGAPGGRPAQHLPDPQRALRAEERRFRALVAASADAVYEMSADWSEIRFVDGRGFVADTTLPTSGWLDQYVPPEEQSTVVRHIQHCVREHGRFDLEHRVIRDDGSLGWTHSRAVPVLDDAGALCAWMGLASDVTERKEAELALRASEEQLRAVTENNVDGIFYVDRTHAIRYLNGATLERLRRALDLPALQPEQLLGRGLAEILGDTDLSRQHRDHDERAMSSGQGSSVEEHSGIGEHMRVRLTRRVPIRDSAGIVIGVLSIARDITERMRDENARLELMRTQRDVLVREVHHRIKNHLQGMLGLLRLQVARHPGVAGPLSETMAQVHAIAGVYGMGAQSGAEGADLGRTIALVVQGAMGAVRLIFENGLDQAALLPEADAVPIALVINEIVTNAVKHGSDAAGERPVRVSLHRDGGAVLLRVRGGPARLPPGFDFAAGRGLGTGLRLLGTLLPSKGAQLRISQQGDEVLAELELREPVVELR